MIVQVVATGDGLVVQCDGVEVGVCTLVPGAAVWRFESPVERLDWMNGQHYASFESLQADVKKFMQRDAA